MTKKQKKMLSRILISAVLFLLLYTVPAQGVVRLLLYLIPYAVIGWDVLWRAVKNIRNGQVFDENFLMSIATIGAFGCGEYPEAVAVMLFYQVGELFQSVAVGRSRQSIAALMDIRPDYANMERDGQLVQVDPDEVAVGDTIVIKAGERVPLDGIVTQGNSALDTAALTGESLPRDVAAGDEVISGCVNLSGLLHVRVTRPFGESTVANSRRSVLRRELPVAVVFHQENHGQILCRRKVDRLMETPLIGSPISKKRHSDLIGVFSFNRQRCPYCNGDSATHDSASSQHSFRKICHVHGATFSLAVASTLSEKLRHNFVHVTAFGDQMTMATVCADNIVIIIQGRTHACTDCLFSNI